MKLRLFVLLVATHVVMSIFTSSAAASGPPVLSAVSPGYIGSTLSVLEGTVDPEGLVTTYHFEYSLDQGFASAISTQTGEITSGPEEFSPSTQEVSAEASGLIPGSTYYFRLVAMNASGSVTGTPAEGTAGSFTTAEAGLGFRSGADGFRASAAKVVGGSKAVQEAIDDKTEVPVTGADEAGSHPYSASFDLGFKEGPLGAPDGQPKEVTFEVPAGLIINPQVPLCKPDDFEVPRRIGFHNKNSKSGESCPAATQLGTLFVETSHGARTFGLFNVTPGIGSLSTLGASPFGYDIFFNVNLNMNPDGSYSLVLKSNRLPNDLNLYGLEMALWGAPWEAVHDRERGDCLNERFPHNWTSECPLLPASSFPVRSQISLPPQCTGPLVFGAQARLAGSTDWISVSTLNRGSDGQPAEMHCNHFQFNPVLMARFDNTRASSPSGFVFGLDADQQPLTAPSLIVPAAARKLIVNLPPGATINPSVGAELGLCTQSQFAAEPSVKASFSGCPRDSRIGTVAVKTPLFDNPISGAVYLARPDDPSTTRPGAENPFDELVAFYVVAQAPARGLVVKLAGHIRLDESDGSATAIVDGLPQLPYEELEVKFRAGARSFLTTPASCGYIPTQINAYPWGEGSPVSVSSYTLIKTGIDGGPCPSGAGPFEPRVVAGAVNSNVNSFSPYLVHISRTDDEQEITSYSLVLPKGVTGKLAGVSQCSNSAIQEARSKQGYDEAFQPSCPQSSRVGRVFTGYGLGSALTYTEGKIYLAGPYHGAPLSLVTINPATLGPFDLGTIVYRVAFQIDPSTAQLRLDLNASDPFPRMRRGLVLHLRDIRIAIDRPEFAHNPSSCEASQLTSTVVGSGASLSDSSDDPVDRPSSFFQLLNCRVLGFRPSLGVRLRGSKLRGGFPELRAAFVARGPKDSNLKQIAVVIPRQEFLAQEHIRGICARTQFLAGVCPTDSIYGRAAAYTPLLDQPLAGNVYLVSSHGALPDLVADLHSGAVRIILTGKIGPAGKGGIRTFFSDLPDQPLDRFVMRLYGGKRGLLVNSANVCSKPPVASIRAIAQNNVGAVFTTALQGNCKKAKKSSHRG